MISFLLLVFFIWVIFQNLLIIISIFESHALEDDWVLFIDQKDLTDVILPFAIVTNDRPMRMVVTSAFSPSIDKPDNTPLVYLLLHL